MVLKRHTSVDEASDTTMCVVGVQHDSLQVPDVCVWVSLCSAAGDGQQPDHAANQGSGPHPEYPNVFKGMFHLYS